MEIDAKRKLNGEDYETQDAVRLKAKAVDELDEIEDRVSTWKIRLGEGEGDCTYEVSVGNPFDITSWWKTSPTLLLRPHSIKSTLLTCIHRAVRDPL